MSTTVTQSAIEQLPTPFIESTRAVFSTMLGVELTLSDACKCRRFYSPFDISGVIGLSGSIKGMLVVGMDTPVAFAIAEELLGYRPTEIDGEVFDMVGELANMICGNAKERMGDPSIALGLPTVVSGANYNIVFHSDKQLHLLCFETPWGPLSIEFGLK
ncbi:MAG: chemotaxis protein CheX [Planctomycetaceae bacterium]|nr:chemotaxis protein CheX [Planctomycetaceae bacterium]